MPSGTPSGLARRSLTSTALLFVTVSASAPMTVIGGSVVATYATTGVRGVPLSFVILTAALAFFTVGYVAMSRHVSHAGPFYAYVAQGLGRVSGVASSLVALLSYNAIQVSLYGLLGATMAALAGWGTWWLWALAAWLVVAVLGVLHVNINARVMAVLLLCEIVMIVLFDVTGFSHPAGGAVSLDPMQPHSLFVTGIGGVLAFGIAAFVGYESAPVYGEEARGPWAVARSTFGSLALLGVLYAVSSWALAVAVGADRIVAAARDPSSGIPFSILARQYGPTVAAIANLLLLTSVFGAMLSFHNTVARYIFALSRERVLLPSLGRIGTGSGAGAPIGGSVLQTVFAVVVIAAFAASGSDPVASLFTWASAIAAIGILLLLLATSLSVIAYFRRRRTVRESAWRTTVAPLVGSAVILAVLVTTVVNINSLLGTDVSSPLTWILPGIVGVTLVVGMAWGLILRRARPDIYRTVGAGELEPLAILEHDLAYVRV